MTYSAISKKTQTSDEVTSIFLTVIDILQVNSWRELVALDDIIGHDRTGVGTPKQFHPHTHRARMLAVRQEPDLAGHDGRLEVLPVGHVGVDIAGHHLVPTGVGVQVPGPGALSPVLQLVRLCKLLSLTPAVPAHGLRPRDDEVRVQVDLEPLPHPGRDGLGRTPGAALQILPGSRKQTLLIMINIRQQL